MQATIPASPLLAHSLRLHGHRGAFLVDAQAVRAAMQAWSLPFFDVPMGALKKDEDAMLKDATLMNLVGGEVSRLSLDALRKDPPGVSNGDCECV